MKRGVFETSSVAALYIEVQQTSVFQQLKVVLLFTLEWLLLLLLGCGLLLFCELWQKFWWQGEFFILFKGIVIALASTHFFQVVEPIHNLQHLRGGERAVEPALQTFYKANQHEASVNANEFVRPIYLQRLQQLQLHLQLNDLLGQQWIRGSSIHSNWTPNDVRQTVTDAVYS